MDRPQLEGPVYSVVTPFDRAGDIDFGALENYINLAYGSGARQFYAMAYNSRYSQLSDDEIRSLNAFVVKAVHQLGSDAVTIVGDPIHCSTRVSAEFCRHASNIGAEFISLIVRERYYSDDQIVAHFKECAAASDVRILVHEMPFISGFGGHTINWPLSLLDRVADVEGVDAIKEDAKDDQYSRDVIRLIRNRLSIVISGGGKRQWLRFADEGCQAWLNGVGVFDPRLPQAFYSAHRAGDDATVRAIIEEVEVPFFNQLVKPFGWHRAIKGALEARGLMSRFERGPMVALSDAEQGVVRDVMEQLEDAIGRIVASNADVETPRLTGLEDRFK